MPPARAHEDAGHDHDHDRDRNREDDEVGMDAIQEFEASLVQFLAMSAIPAIIRTLPIMRPGPAEWTDM